MLHRMVLFTLHNILQVIPAVCSPGIRLTLRRGRGQAIRKGQPHCYWIFDSINP